MKKVIIMIIVIFGLISCSGPGNNMDTSADIEQIRELIRKSTEANNRGDVDGWVDLFDDNAVYMTNGMPEISTKEGLEEVARSGFTSGKTDIVMTPDEIEVLGDWAFARSQIKGIYTPNNDDTPLPIDMKQIAIYRRQADGSWKIARLIGNSNRD